MRRTDTSALGLLVLMAAFIGLDSVDAPARSERSSKKPAVETAKLAMAKKAAAPRPIVLPPPPALPAQAMLPVSPRPQAKAAPPKESAVPPQPLTPASPIIVAPASPITKTITPLQPTKAAAPVPPARTVTALKPEPRRIPRAKLHRITALQTANANSAPGRSVERIPVTPRTPPDEKSISTTGAEKPVEITANGNLASGRVMLRLLEHDTGPQIRLIWPDDAGKSAGLYLHLSACFGMISAVMTADGKLFRDSGEAGQPWALDIDHFSGFIRAAEGVLPSGERRVVRNIRAKHRLEGGAIVRVFPRWVDAGLLTGMQAIVGPAFRTAKRIDARYVGGTNDLEIIGMTIDGKPAKGRVRLRAPGSCG